MTPDEQSQVEEFMEGMMVDLTYDIVTKKVILSDYINTAEQVVLSYDPFATGEIDQSWLLQDLMEYYIDIEDYEKCAKLLQMKISVESGELDLSDRIYLKDEDFIDINPDIQTLIASHHLNRYNLN